MISNCQFLKPTNQPIDSHSCVVCIAPTFWHTLLVLTAVLWLSGCQRITTQYDREVDRLCAIDGGIHIYEKVRLPENNFDEKGRLKNEISRDFITNEQSPYRVYFENQSVANKGQFLLRTSIGISKIRMYVIRSIDKKILGESIRYVRGGGDLFGPWAGSSYSCPKSTSDLINTIFIQDY